MKALLKNLANCSDVDGILWLLAKSSDRNVRYRVAISWNTPYELQEFLSGDKNEAIAMEASDKLVQMDYEWKDAVDEADE